MALNICNMFKKDLGILSTWEVEKTHILQNSKTYTLIMFYKQRPNKETSWQMSSFDSCCLTVAYFLLKI